MQCATIQNFFGWFELATQCLFCRLQWGSGRILGNNFQILNIANHMNIWRWCYTCRKTLIFFCTAKVWNMCIPTNWIMVAKKILGMANQKSGSSKIFHGRFSRKWLHIVISCYIMLYRPIVFFFHTYFIIVIPLIFITECIHPQLVFGCWYPNCQVSWLGDAVASLQSGPEKTEWDASDE